MEFKYFQPTHIVFGSGTITEVGEHAAKFGKRILVVTVPLFSSIQEGFDKITESCKKSGVEVYHYEGVIPNPTVDSVEKGVALAKEKGVEVVLGYGGGSSMDTAKAIAVGATHEGSPWDYLFYKKPPTEKTLPVIAVTTTSGTGSQVTQVSVMTDEKTHEKSAIFNDNIYPRVAIVDPDLMVNLPPRVTAITGFDAFTHAFEAFIHNGTNVYVETLAVKAMALISENLADAIRKGSAEARKNMALADTLAGLCIASAGVTLPHGIGMTISGYCPAIAHGEALALTYPSFVRFTAEAVPQKFGIMAKILDKSLFNMSDVDASKKAGEVMEKFLKDIGMWISFKNFNVEKSIIRDIADHSHDLPDYKSNPKIASIEEIYNMLEVAYERV